MPSHRKIPTGWLEKPSELGEGPGVLSHSGGPRKWGLSHCLAVYSPLMFPQHWSKLCFRVPLRLQKDRCFWRQGVASSLDGSQMSLGLGDLCPQFSF